MGFTQALAREVAADGIRVNCVCPGFVRTSMQEREVAWEAKMRGMRPEAVLDDYVGADAARTARGAGGRGGTPCCSSPPISPAS